MMLKNLMLPFLLIGLVVGTSTYADQIQCPTTLPVTETTNAKEEGWPNASIVTPKSLKSWAIYEDNINADSQLAPESSEQNHALIQTWALTPNKTYWLQCNYFETAVTLARKIPSSMKHCESILALDKNHNVKAGGTVICK